MRKKQPPIASNAARQRTVYFLLLFEEGYGWSSPEKRGSHEVLDLSHLVWEDQIEVVVLNKGFRTLSGQCTYEVRF